MEGTAHESSRLKRVLAGPLLRVGALATLLSASANVLVLAGASSLFGPVVIPPEEVVTIGQVMGASTAGAVGAGRWPLCTWWPRSPTSVCSQGWAGRGRACWGD